MTKKRVVVPASAAFYPLVLPSPLCAVCFVYTGLTECGFSYLGVATKRADARLLFVDATYVGVAGLAERRSP